MRSVEVELTEEMKIDTKKCGEDADCEECSCLLGKDDCLWNHTTERDVRRNKIHELKILPEYFKAVCSGNKNFELRKDDRDYMVGDYIDFYEFDGKQYTGRSLKFIKINYILRNCPEYGLADGYCILGF